MFHEETRSLSEDHETSRNDLLDQFQRCNSLDALLDLATRPFQFVLARETVSLHETVLSNGNEQEAHSHLTSERRANVGWKAEKLGD
jgi:hypothetical protein